MSDSIDNTDSLRKSDMANFGKNRTMHKSSSVTSGSKPFALLPLKPITAIDKWKIGDGTGAQVASFLIKMIALETVRRFSRARCPFVWTGLQALQVLCYPPLKWIQRWNPFGVMVKGMQILSRPLLVLSVVNAISDHSDSCDFALDDIGNSIAEGDSQLNTESQSGSPLSEGTNSMGTSDEVNQVMQPTDWMNLLLKELENLGITLPERINKAELQRFYIAANGDFLSLLSSVKKTIQWRETYRILSIEELETWSNLVFWHGLDVKGRPCLIIRLGMACSTLPSRDRPLFVQAVVSQVEYGILHLVDEEDPRITVLLDCLGVSPLRFPMQMLRYCCNILQDHYPNILGCLIIIRLPPVVRVIAQTFIKVLKPATKEKLRIEGDMMYRKVLHECFQAIPSYLGGVCTCTKCGNLDRGILREILDSTQAASVATGRGFVNTEDCPIDEPTHQYDMIMDSNNSRILRGAVIGVLIIWILIAFIEGIYDPESRPSLPI